MIYASLMFILACAILVAAVLAGMYDRDEFGCSGKN